MAKLKQKLENSFEFLTEMAQESIDKARYSMVVYGDRKKYVYHKNRAANYLAQAEKVNRELEFLTIINLN